MVGCGYGIVSTTKEGNSRYYLKSGPKEEVKATIDVRKLFGRRAHEVVRVSFGKLEDYREYRTKDAAEKAIARRHGKNWFSRCTELSCEVRVQE